MSMDGWLAWPGLAWLDGWMDASIQFCENMKLISTANCIKLCADCRAARTYTLLIRSPNKTHHHGINGEYVS